MEIYFPEPCARFRRGLQIIVKGRVTGATNPTTVAIYIDKETQAKGQCQADADGYWKWTTGPPWGWNTGTGEYQRGVHTIRAEAKDKNGLTGWDLHVISLSGMVWPCRGQVTSGFGPRKGKIHHGIDIANVSGTEIAAVEDGTVSSQQGYSPIYGYYRNVEHGDMYVRLVDGYTTNYESVRVSTRCAHMIGNKSTPAAGRISQRNFVGGMDCTGENPRWTSCNHLHFEVRENDVCVNPRNGWLP